MTENLTRREKLVEPASDLHAVPGHRLVVFKRVGEGLEFRSIVDPGQSFKRFFLESPDSFVAYKVTCDRHLQYRFSERISTLDNTRSFILHATLFYYVRDPRVLVEKVGHDPLRRVQEEAIRIWIELLDWSVVEEGGQTLQHLLWREGSRNSEKIRDIARDLGIEITQLKLERRLPSSTTLKTQLIGDRRKPALGASPSIFPLTDGALPEVLSSAFAHMSLVEPVARYSISLAILHLLGELLADRARGLDYRETLDRIFQVKARELSREEFLAVRATSRDAEIGRLYEKLADLRSLEGGSSNGRTERELSRTYSQLRKLQLEEAAELRNAAEEKLLMPLGAGKELLGRIDRLLDDDEDRAS